MEEQQDVTLPLWSAWTIFFGVGFILIPMVYFVPAVEHLDLWQKILFGFIIAAFVTSFIIPLIRIKPGYEWALYILIILCLIMPIILFTARFITNMIRLPDQIKD